MDESDAPSVESPADDENVMASIDASDGEERLVIADLEREDAWVSMESGGATPLAEWA